MLKGKALTFPTTKETRPVTPLSIASFTPSRSRIGSISRPTKLTFCPAAAMQTGSTPGPLPISRIQPRAARANTFDAVSRNSRLRPSKVKRQRGLFVYRRLYARSLSYLLLILDQRLSMGTPSFLPQRLPAIRSGRGHGWQHYDMLVSALLA